MVCVGVECVCVVCGGGKCEWCVCVACVVCVGVESAQ